VCPIQVKYIKMAASSNFGNVFSILVASAWLPFSPMRPIQLLTQNLLYDFSQVDSDRVCVVWGGVVWCGVGWGGVGGGLLVGQGCKEAREGAAACV
jgi:hypothetical protein